MAINIAASSDSHISNLSPKGTGAGIVGRSLVACERKITHHIAPGRDTHIPAGSGADAAQIIGNPIIGRIIAINITRSAATSIHVPISGASGNVAAGGGGNRAGSEIGAGGFTTQPTELYFIRGGKIYTTVFSLNKGAAPQIHSVIFRAGNNSRRRVERRASGQIHVPFSTGIDGCLVIQNKIIARRQTQTGGGTGIRQGPIGHQFDIVQSVKTNLRIVGQVIHTHGGTTGKSVRVIRKEDIVGID